MAQNAPPIRLSCLGTEKADPEITQALCRELQTQIVARALEISAPDGTLHIQLTVDGTTDTVVRARLNWRHVDRDDAVKARRAVSLNLESVDTVISESQFPRFVSDLVSLSDLPG